MSLGLELIRAGAEHEAALGNLLELYIHDFSELIPLDVGEDGRFGYRNLSLYWSDVSRLPLLARLQGKLVGFALVTRNSCNDGQLWDMAEFFVLRRYRHRGIGTELAIKLWGLCPGKWQIRVMEKNHSARSFWQSAITKFTGISAQPSTFVTDGMPWYSFSFDSHP
jgi:predicted acetyltransferase